MCLRESTTGPHATFVGNLHPIFPSHIHASSDGHGYHLAQQNYMCLTHFEHQSSNVVHEIKRSEAIKRQKARRCYSHSTELCESSVHFASATSIFAATNSSSIFHRSIISIVYFLFPGLGFVYFGFARSFLPEAA